MDRDGQAIALGLKGTEWETVNLPESRCFKRHTVNVHNYLNERKVAFDPGEAGKYKIEALDERGAVVGVPIDAKGGTIGAGDYVCILGINLNQALAENVQLDEDLRQENETVEMYETALMEAMGKLRSLSAQIKALGRRIGDALGGEAPAEGIEALEGALRQLIGKKEELEGEVGQLKENLARSEENLKQITSAKEALEVKVSQLGDQLEELREKNASLEGTKSQLSSRVGELEASVNGLKASLDETNGTLQTVEANLAEAKNKITENKELIARLESQLAEVDATLKSAREKVVEDLEGVLKGKGGQGSKTVEALRDIAAGKETETGKAARVEGRLTQKVISATKKKRAVKSENAALQGQIAELQRQLEAAQADLERMRKPVQLSPIPEVKPGVRARSRRLDLGAINRELNEMGT